MMKRAAEMVRTGDTITSAFAQRGFSIEVAYTIRERFVSPEGVISETVWYAGWDNFGKWRDRCAGQIVGHEVYIIREARECPAAFGEVA